MFTIGFIALGVLAVSIVVAASLVQRGRSGLGAVLGLVPLALMEAVLHGSLQLRIHRCFDSACASAGLPPGCTIAAFGCTEWSGLSVFFFWAVGAAAAVLYLLALLVIILLDRRRKRGETAGAEPIGSGSGQA